jgi:hypothetical protein
LTSPDDGQWLTEPEDKCPGCASVQGRRIEVSLACPGYTQNGQLMMCIGCGNAVMFECVAPDEDGDLFEPGCGWWFQFPLHPRASTYPAMGRAPEWDYKRYRL